MAWIFQLFLGITLITVSAYNYKHHANYRAHFDYSDQDYSDESTEFFPTRRIDHGNYRSNHRGHERMNERSAKPTEPPMLRMNERSISVNTGIQTVQELERRRVEQKADDVMPRVENGSYKIVNDFPKSYSSVAYRRGQNEDGISRRDSVVFPGPISKSSNQYVPEIPQECINAGFCEDPPNYPEDYVSNIITQLGEKIDRFKVDVIDMPEVAQRIGGPDEVELCEYTIKVAIPKAAPDREGNWFYILNRKDKPLQGFQVEVCKANKSPCSKLAYFYTGYEASCNQKYVLRHMTALDVNGNMVEKPFKLPSCCSCVVKQIE